MGVVYAIVWPLAAIFLVLAAIYIFAPSVLFNAVRNALRRRGKLSPKMVICNGMTWPYLEGGPSDGEPLVLIHGFGADKDSWSLYAKELTQTYRVISPDLPGFGENMRDVAADYQIVQQVHRLREFLDALGIDKCHMAGNSMGGFIALQFALEYPDRLRSLTLFNNAGVIGAEESHLQKEVTEGRNPLLINSADDVKRMIAYVSHRPQPIPGGFRKVMFEQFDEHRELMDKIFWQIAEGTLEQPLNDRLSEVHVPTMIIWGRHDQLIDVSVVDVLAAGIPNNEKVVFEDMGHIPMIENPSKVAAVHLPFLAKH